MIGAVPGAALCTLVLIWSAAESSWSAIASMAIERSMASCVLRGRHCVVHVGVVSGRTGDLPRVLRQQSTLELPRIWQRRGCDRDLQNCLDLRVESLDLAGHPESLRCGLRRPHVRLQKVVGVREYAVDCLKSAGNYAAERDVDCSQSFRQESTAGTRQLSVDLLGQNEGAQQQHQCQQDSTATDPSAYPRASAFRSTYPLIESRSHCLPPSLVLQNVSHVRLQLACIGRVAFADRVVMCDASRFLPHHGGQHLLRHRLAPDFARYGCRRNQR